jgi:hypothetical protein
MSNKISKRARKERRKKEILKAQMKSGLQEEISDEPINGKTPASKPRKITHRLPLKEIRTDLMKTAIYVILVIVLLVVLKSQGLEFNFGINK